MFNETNPLSPSPYFNVAGCQNSSSFWFFLVPCFRSIDLGGGGFKVFPFDIVKVSLVAWKLWGKKFKSQEP